VPREHEKATPTKELVLASGNDLGAALARLVGFVVVVLALEAGRDGSLAQHHVESLLDVVGVELFVEVDDIVVFLFLDYRLDRHGYETHDRRNDDALYVYQWVLDLVFVLEECIIEFLLDYYFLVEVFLVDLGFVFELVFAHSAGRLVGELNVAAA
jgi:uncharacterized membrane protein YjfL (UPF0719 family)